MDAQRIFSPTVAHRYSWPKPRASMVRWGEDKAYSGSEAYAPSSGRFLVRGGLSHGGSTEAVLVTRWFLCCCVSQKCIAWAFVLPEGSNHPKVVVDASADSMTPGVARAPSMSPLSTLPSSHKSDDVIMARLRRDDRQPVVARRLRSAGPTLHASCLAPKCRCKKERCLDLPKVAATCARRTLLNDIAYRPSRRPPKEPRNIRRLKGAISSHDRSHGRHGPRYECCGTTTEAVGLAGTCTMPPPKG